MGFFGHGRSLSVSKDYVDYIQKVETRGMTIQAVFFDMGGTIETYGYTRALRLEATPGLQQQLLAAGIDLHLDNEQLFEVISAGLERYHQSSLKNLDELSPSRVWREYILSDHPVDQGQLR